MDEKVLVALISVAVGWVLAQATAFTKDWWTARKLRRGLLVELEDIQNQLDRVILIHTRHLQIFAVKGMAPASALPIQNMFFSQNFQDTFSHLNREQRISYQLIHASLQYLNKKNDDLALFAEESYKELRMAPDDTKKLATIDVWGERVIAIYKTAKDIHWHIDYHLRNRDAPSFDILGPMHESYLQFAHELDNEVKTILEKARSLKREDFETIYDEKAFAAGRSSD